MHRNIPQTILDLAPERSHQTVMRTKVGDRWRDIDWQRFAHQVRRFAGGLLALGIEPGDRVAIMSPNRPEWAFADLAIMACGGVTVPVYHTESAEAAAYILNNSGSRFAFVRAIDEQRKIESQLPQLPDLEAVILIEGDSDHELVMPLRRFLPDTIDDQLLDRRLAEVKRAELATIVYTSGTTGPPKGAMLTHDNILSAVEAAASIFEISPADSCLSFLPLSHVFERVDGYYFMLIQGATINYAESIDSVPVNLQEVSPTVVISVPRLFEKMYARVMERIGSGSWLKKQIFFAALKACTRHLHLELNGREIPGWLESVTRLARDKVFGKLRQPLGGNIRFFVSGGAPLARNVAEFFLAAGIPIYEGYGLTETAAGITANCAGQVRLGTVGRCMPNTELRIADDGEILIRGKTVFKGYWQNPVKSDEALRDGWFHTGDIGHLDQDGFLSITDRKKDLIITAGGENIAPQPIENRLKADKFIANAFVFGNRKPYLVALIVPNFDNLEKYARQKKLPYLDHCGLVTHPAILDLVRRRIDRLQTGQPGFMHIKRFTLMSRDFSGREITPTLKLKRKIIRDTYADLIERMYLPQDHGVHDAGFCLTDSD